MIILQRKLGDQRSVQELQREICTHVNAKYLARELTDISSPLLTTGEAAKLLAYSPRSLDNSRVSGLLGGVPAPMFVKLGRTVRYRKDTLEIWVH